MIKFFLSLLLLVFISCSESINDPTTNKDGELRKILVRDANKLLSYSYQNKTKEIVFNRKDKSILSFDYNKETGNIFMVLYESDIAKNKNYTSLVKLDQEGDLIEIRKDTSKNGEGFSSYNNINVSKNEKYLALDGMLYEGGFFSVYDLEDNIFISFNGKQYTEYVEFFMWSPDGNGIYVHSHDYLVFYDLINKTITMLDSPNIRDYLTEEYLIQYGYVGKRFDYMQAVGIDNLKYVNWNTSSSKFLYINDNTLFLYDLISSKSEEILSVEKYVSFFGKYFYVIWDVPSNSQTTFPYLNNNDMIVSFDSTVLNTIPNLNDSLNYKPEKNYSISYMRPNWNNWYQSMDKYYFRKEISAEKFHIAEFDFHLWYYALEMTPTFWFLVTDFDDFNFDSSKFVQQFSDYITEYYQDYTYFKTLNYPKGLEQNRELYEKSILIDYKFQVLFLSFFKSKDTLKFKDDVYSLLSHINKSEIDSVFALLSDTNIQENKRVIHFYATIHNNFLNYYGLIIVKDIDSLLKEQLIEFLEDDWIYKVNGLMTREYLRNKIYSYQ
ncbi:hypothetical protein MNBD_IGNAVI01-55 [hydrothermal vent metagenome]|uniref:Lipoprotein n=1 Tax=hydrothermal vent metagenome TaxID=652676 RepID=A0A3B1CIN3_9ZZZZ